MVGKQTSKRNAKEKQDFFKGKVIKTNTRNIFFIKTPNPCFCKQNVPHHKDESGDQVSNKIWLEVTMELNPSMKGKNKWNNDSKKVD
jgi:hypothetical protein